MLLVCTILYLTVSFCEDETGRSCAFFFLRSEAESCVGFREPNSLNSKADELGGIVRQRKRAQEVFCDDLVLWGSSLCFSMFCYVMFFSYLPVFLFKTKKNALL